MYMKLFKGSVIVGLLSVLAWTVGAEQKDKVHPFPKPEEGFKRTVIRLPKLANEADCKVEIIIGKVMKVDLPMHALEPGRRIFRRLGILDREDVRHRPPREAVDLVLAADGQEVGQLRAGALGGHRFSSTTNRHA